MNSYGSAHYIFTRHIEPFAKKTMEEYPPDNPNEFYHYTSLSNCLNLIARDPNNNTYQMFASHLGYLNDKEEYENGFKLVHNALKKMVKEKVPDEKEILSKLKENIRNFIGPGERFSNDIVDRYLQRELFIICFCKKGNLLSQWKYYGKNSGVAIQYDLENCEFSGHVVPVEKNVYYSNHAYNVIYNDDIKTKIINDIINKMKEECESSEDKLSSFTKRYLSILLSVVPFFKHTAFEEETEARLVFRPLYLSGNKDLMRKIVCYREREGVIIPYIKIKIKNKNNDNASIIKSLTVGPGKNQDLVFQALQHYIMTQYEKTDYASNERIPKNDSYYSVKINGVEIRKAKNPFRD